MILLSSKLVKNFRYGILKVVNMSNDKNEFEILCCLGDTGIRLEEKRIPILLMALAFPQPWQYERQIYSLWHLSRSILRPVTRTRLDNKENGEGSQSDVWDQGRGRESESYLMASPRPWPSSRQRRLRSRWRGRSCPCRRPWRWGWQGSRWRGRCRPGGLGPHGHPSGDPEDLSWESWTLCVQTTSPEVVWGSSRQHKVMLLYS